MQGTTKRAMWQMAIRTAALLSLAGCGGGFFPPLTTTTGGGGTGTTSGDFVYVANATASTVAGFALATSTAGAASLTAVSGSPVALPAPPSAIAITPANTYLFVAVTGAIYAYSINTSTGVLSLANGGAAAVNSLGIVSIDISPDGQWLVALANDGATINEYQINGSTGALAAVTGPQPYTTSGGIAALPKMIRFAPNGAYVGVALGTGGDLIIPFTTSTGAFAINYPQLPTGDSKTGDNAIIIDSASTFAYVARSGTTNGVAVYSLGANGVPAAVAGSPFAAGGGTFALQIDSTGKYLYAANRTDGTISGFSIGTGGVLAALGGSPYASGSGVTSLARDNTAKYLLGAASGGTPDLTLYSFDSTVGGKLVSATTTASGTDPAGSIAVAATH